jgi:hypothetical protein
MGKMVAMVLMVAMVNKARQVAKAQRGRVVIQGQKAHGGHKVFKAQQAQPVRRGHEAMTVLYKSLSNRKTQAQWKVL